MTRGRSFNSVLLAGCCLAVLSAAATAAPYFDGFEGSSPANSWQLHTTAVPSGTGGITSASGAYHAVVTPDAFTRFGGYSSVFPAAGFRCAVDVYLDLDGGYANDARFDYSVAINDPAGSHRRDFIFSGGFYNDSDATGTGNRFVFTASNNAPGWPKNPGRTPQTITQSGWYTLEHTFYDAGGGVLAVDMAILNSGGSVVAFWSLSDASDIIGSTVGGHRYGWFVGSNYSPPASALPSLAIDNTVREDLSEDSDGDGVLDPDDHCPNSDLSPTVVIDGVDTGITNVLVDNGCTISDLIAECAASAKNHGQFVSCVTALANDLRKQGVITNKEKSTLTKTAAKSNLP